MLALVAFAGACSLLNGGGGQTTQGWTAAERNFFYYTTQGSHLIPRAWFLALERHDSTQRFLADGLQRFGYLPGEQVSLYNPDRLPIGFAVDGHWIGMTCAACHTSDIERGGTRLRIDGAPASADMYEFLAKLDLALQKAAGDNAAFLRFAARVLGPNDTPANRAVLLDDPDRNKGLRAFSAHFKQFVIDSTPTPPLQWGPARLDAFGMIFNRVAAIDLNIPTNNRPPNAPVSYPFLWSTSWHKWTQWNAAVENNSSLLGELRRLGRNVGQVLGVFGTANFIATPTYPSSVKRWHLEELERTVARLTAPEWPTQFGAPVPARVALGEALYRNQGCINCHRLVPKDRQNEPADVSQVSVSLVGTDPEMTNMAATRTADTGVFQGRRSMIITGPVIGPTEKVVDLLSHAVLGVMFDDAFSSSQVSTLSTPFQLVDTAATAARYYKARPLNGIWATGPYLHNGSVRTLYQLLLPPAQREVRFWVGSRQFDPVQVGFINAPGVIAFELDTLRPGNLNIGHPFGTGLSESQRYDLIEYLKTL